MSKKRPRGGGSWSSDIHGMHAGFGVHEVVERMDRGTLRTLLRFRVEFLREESEEMEDAYSLGDPEGLVDSIIDWIVVGIGTLDLMGVDPQVAWDAVLSANLAKVAGVNPTRPNPLGLPDLVKPEGWTPPDHSGNLGSLLEVMSAHEVWPGDVGGEGGGA